MKEYIIDKLHEKHGYYGHCGKVKCHGKESHSQLPSIMKVDTDWFLEILSDFAISLKSTDLKTWIQ